MAKSAVPHSTIHAMLVQRCGTIAHFSQLNEGLSSQAFGFRSNDGEYVIRINPVRAGFEKDRFAAQHFSCPALPIPAILEIGQLDAAHAFCISRRAPGVRLYDNDAELMPRLVAPVVETIAAIAAADLTATQGFGWFDAAGNGPSPTWHDFVTSIIDRRRFHWEGVREQVEQRRIAALGALVERLAAYCPEQRHLIHGDFGSFNLLSDGQRITAVIDWDRAVIGDPLYEIANLFFWGETRLAGVRQHLRDQFCHIPHWRERILCYQLRIGLQEVYESAIGAGPGQSAWLLQRCEAIASDY